MNSHTFYKTKTTDILPTHDLVFKAPVWDPTYGIPLGDGSRGYLLWFEENKLNININSTDLIDDVGEGDFYFKREDETHAVCRNGAKLSLDFGCPVFGEIYQNDFEARLSLKNATATIENKTPFVSSAITAFASEKSKVAIVSVHTEGTDEISLRSTLERWGSRTFMYWYIRYKPDVSIGLGGTSTCIKEDIFCVSQKLGGMCFTVAVQPVASCNTYSKKRGGQCIECETDCQKEIKIDYYITLTTGETTEETEKEGFLNLENAVRRGKEEIYKEHTGSWESFWNKSYVSLGEDESFAENLWYLNLYYGNSQMRGKYPPHFCNGVWGFYHDFVPWNMYFHYNTQLAFNSYNGANHPELCETYFNFRKNQLPKAKRYAREIKKTEGAFFTDISDLKGRMIADEVELSKNCTCGAQIAMLMYKNYLYTGDAEFLRDTALPFMEEIGKFYLDMLKMGNDGIYHIYDTTAYEGSPLFDDSITDLVAVRSLFSALAKELGTDEGDIYRERLDALADFVTADLTADETENGRFVHGIGKGMECKGTKVLAAGKLSGSNPPDITEKYGAGTHLRKTFGTPDKNSDSYYGFPDVELAPIYPSGIVGIKDKGTDIYNMLLNSIYMHHPALESEADHKKGMCMGWCMMPVYLARMGMAKELKDQLRRSISTWIAFPQGFGLYGGYEGPGGRGANTRRSTRDRFINVDILKIAGEHKDEVVEFHNDFFDDKPEYHSTMNLWNFRHFDYEALPILSCAINEMLLQSYGGTVRLFGAVGQESEVSFKLAAEGGFVIYAEYKNGECKAVIESLRGEELRIVFENVNGTVAFYERGNTVASSRDGDAYIIHTLPGMILTAISEKGEEISIERNAKPNEGIKRLGDAQLGCEKMF